ncbi:MAG: Disaggregatase related repeat [Archaeoglobaceae archaeon]|nr:Disaggregatase related repeat [Archaeoglobaceae archaeon]
MLNPWYEENITWNSHLNLNIATEPTYTAFISGKGWIWWDVTIDVQDIADGGANYGWCIKDADESGNKNKYVEYNSREANKNNPYLEIIYID